jgi:hypothetical protein
MSNAYVAREFAQEVARADFTELVERAQRELGPRFPNYKEFVSNAIFRSAPPTQQLMVHGALYPTETSLFQERSKVDTMVTFLRSIWEYPCNLRSNDLLKIRLNNTIEPMDSLPILTERQIADEYTHFQTKFESAKHRLEDSLMITLKRFILYLVNFTGPILPTFMLIDGERYPRRAFSRPPLRLDERIAQDFRYFLSINWAELNGLELSIHPDRIQRLRDIVTSPVPMAGGRRKMSLRRSRHRRQTRRGRN